MRIAVAPNAFRGSLSALEAVEAISTGLRNSHLTNLEIIAMPLADGGDGTLDMIGSGGERVAMTVTGPLDSPDNPRQTAEFCILKGGQSAVIEVARASGVELVPNANRNPLKTTSYGTGELMAAAVERGCHRLWIGLGGSATVDGAAGCLQALGARLLDSNGKDIPPGGVGLAKLASIDVSALRQKYARVEVTALCDVTNPLLGPDGAARIFGPQKGADPAAVEQLEANLSHFAEIVRRDLGVDVTTIPHGGAAGGFGAGLHAFLNAKLVPGGRTLINLLGYERQLRGVDVLITGEGKLDSQTAGGKAVQTIAEIATQYGIPVVALVGVLSADGGALRHMGIQSAWSILPGPCSLEEALVHGPQWLAQAATELGNLLAMRLPTSGENPPVVG